MDNVTPITSIEPFRAFGEVAGRIVDRLRPKAHALAAAADNPDLPLELVYERKLRAAAFDAKDRGAELSIVRVGIMVRKGGKIEIVRFDQVCSDVLLRALNRVAPHAWESAGFDRP